MTTQEVAAAPGIPTGSAYPLPTRDGLPPNMVRWTVDPARAVVLVHDMQRYFLASIPDTPRGDLVANTTRLRRRAVELGVPVAYTAQPGGMTPLQRGLLKDFWGPGMTTGPRDREVTPELAPGPADRMFVKWRYSAFFNSGLLTWMRELGRDQIVLCGVFAHIGVLSTALDAYTNDIRPFLVADALGDFSPDHHRFALEHAARCCGMVVLTEEVFQ